MMKEILINGERYRHAVSVITYGALMEKKERLRLRPADGPDPVALLIGNPKVTYSKGPAQNPAGTLCAGDGEIAIIDDMEFIVTNMEA